LDATALVKLVVPEPESDDLNQSAAGLTSVIVSDLALTEMASALGRRRREQRLTRYEAQRLYREASKLRASAYRAELTPPIHQRAERLLLSVVMPLRTLDALKGCSWRPRRGEHRASSSPPHRCPEEERTLAWTWASCHFSPS
jgi:predicted nucleic acid-binding protein